MKTGDTIYWSVDISVYQSVVQLSYTITSAYVSDKCLQESDEKLQNEILKPLPFTTTEPWDQSKQ